MLYHAVCWFIIAHRAIKVYDKDFSAIAKELDPESLEPINDPYMLQQSYDHPQEFAAEVEAFEKQASAASRSSTKPSVSSDLQQCQTYHPTACGRA